VVDSLSRRRGFPEPSRFGSAHRNIVREFGCNIASYLGNTARQVLREVSVPETPRQDYSATSLFLPPGGRPRRRFVTASSFSLAIQADGRPRRLVPPAARRSSARMASSICARSRRSSASILVISISPPIWQFRLARRWRQPFALSSHITPQSR